MRRIVAYVTTWGAIIAALFVCRFTYFKDAPVEVRMPLGIFAMGSTGILTMFANTYEQRRVALAAGYRGRGVLGYLRGWAKTFVVDLTANDDQIPAEILREYRVVHLCAAVAFVSLFILVPLLIV